MSEVRTINLALKEALRRAMGASRLSRKEIARELRQRVGRGVSLAMLEAWTSDTKPNYIPADCVPALCDILADDAILRQLLSPKQLEDLELGASITKAEARAVARALGSSSRKGDRASAARRQR